MRAATEGNFEIIRQARKQDIPDLVKLLKELFSLEKDFKFNAEKQKKGLRLLFKKVPAAACVLVAEHKGRCIGMVTAQAVVSTAEGAKSALIEDMVISKAYRGRGVGSRLLCALESWCKIKGIGRMQLLADKDNSSALCLYKKMKWQSTGLVGYRKYNIIGVIR